MLEQGREQLHQPVLWIVHEFMVKLEETGQVNLSVITQNIISVVSSHLKVCIVEGCTCWSSLSSPPQGSPLAGSSLSADSGSEELIHTSPTSHPSSPNGGHWLLPPELAWSNTQVFNGSRSFFCRFESCPEPSGLLQVAEASRMSGECGY